MKKLLLLLLLAGCTKVQESHNGTYYGTVEYMLPGYAQQTTCRRVISDNTAGTTKIHWFDAPVVDCYTVIENDMYPITNVTIVADYQIGPCSKNKLVFCGEGKFIGDSLIETGIVYHFTEQDTTYVLSGSGSWRGCFKKL